MKHLNLYSTVVGELPKLVASGEPELFIPLSEVKEFKDKIVRIMSDKSHTPYQNQCYLNFLLSKVGMK